MSKKQEADTKVAPKKAEANKKTKDKDKKPGFFARIKKKLEIGLW